MNLCESHFALTKKPRTRSRNLLYEGFFFSEEQYNTQLMPHTGRLLEPEKFVRNMQVNSNVVKY